MTETVEVLIEQLTSNLEEATEHYRNYNYSEEEIAELVDTILESLQEDPEKMMADPTQMLASMSKISDIGLKGWRKKVRYQTFQLTPRIAKLSFEDYNRYRDEEERLTLKMATELAGEMNRRLMPILMEKMMGPMGGMFGEMFGGLFGGGDGFLPGLDNWKQQQDSNDPLGGLLNIFQPKPAEDSEDEDDS